MLGILAKNFQEKNSGTPPMLLQHARSVLETRYLLLFPTVTIASNRFREVYLVYRCYLVDL